MLHFRRKITSPKCLIYIPSVPDSQMSQMAHMSHVSQMAHMSQVSQVFQMSHVSQISQLSHVSKIFNVSQLSHVSQMSHVSQISHVSHISQMSQVSQISHVSRMPNVSRMSQILQIMLENIFAMANINHIGGQSHLLWLSLCTQRWGHVGWLSAFCPSVCPLHFCQSVQRFLSCRRSNTRC